MKTPLLLAALVFVFYLSFQMTHPSRICSDHSQMMFRGQPMAVCRSYATPLPMAGYP